MSIRAFLVTSRIFLPVCASKNVLRSSNPFINRRCSAYSSMAQLAAPFEPGINQDRARGIFAAMSSLLGVRRHLACTRPARREGACPVPFSADLILSCRTRNWNPARRGRATSRSTVLGSIRTQRCSIRAASRTDSSSPPLGAAAAARACATISPSIFANARAGARSSNRREERSATRASIVLLYPASIPNFTAAATYSSALVTARGSSRPILRSIPSVKRPRR